MSAWGNGSFENDDAQNYLATLATITFGDLTQIFVQAADNPEYLEAPAASVVVVAAEAIAALNGFPAQGVPPQILQCTANQPPCTPELKALALRALERVRKNSELKDLWLEGDGLNDWVAALQELQVRLES
jgi:hypothetical protein